MNFRMIIWVLSLCGGLGLSGCAFSGSVGEGPRPELSPYTKLPDAMEHAGNVLKAIDEKQKELDKVRGLTNAGLYAAGTGAGAAGVFGGSDDIIKGFVVAAGGILGIVDYAQVAQKWGILDNGKEAIFCATEQTATYAFVRDNYTNKLVQKSDSTGELEFHPNNEPIMIDLTARIKAQFLPDLDLDQELFTSKFNDLEEQEKVSASFMSGALKARGLFATQKVGFVQATLNVGDGKLADTLTRTVERIRAELEKQLRAASPDPKQIFANQRQTIGDSVAKAINALEAADAAANDARSFVNAVSVLGEAPMTTIDFTSLGILGQRVDMSAEQDIAAALEKLKKIADCLNTVTPGTPEPTG